MKVVWSAEANDQLIRTTDIIEERFGERVKLDFLKDVDHIVSLLESAPYLGKEEPLLKDAPISYRSLVVNQINKLVYYINNDLIEIVAIWDTRREPKALVEDLEEPKSP